MKTQRSFLQLVIFVKVPRTGQVKSRLALTIGDSLACAAYQKLVEHLLEKLRGLESVEIRFTPDDARDELEKWLGKNFQYARQGSGDLGARLHRAFQENFEVRNAPVIVIGSDCPYVAKADIESASNALATHDVVLGPASDGGYWLIGLREAQPALFENIPWSTETVLATTLCRIRSQKLSCHLLRTLDDIDVAEDWRNFLSSL